MIYYKVSKIIHSHYTMNFSIIQEKFLCGYKQFGSIFAPITLLLLLAVTIFIKATLPLQLTKINKGGHLYAKQ